MSSESNDSPPGQFLKSLTESIAQLLRWIAELIRQRNWYMLLVLFGVVLALLAHLSHNQLNNIFKGFQPTLSIVLWVIVGLIFVGALVIAFITLPRSQPPKLEDLTERKAIKGLRPFGLEDADIFAQLQRDRLLRDCIEIIANPTFQFGILVGESGCGKTSFLQAGVLPQFLRSESKCSGVYVRFSDQSPIAAIQQALAEQLEIPMDWLTDTTGDYPLLGLFEKAVDAAEKPVALFLDQFEQWYVHAKQPEDRQPFLQGLIAWYKQPQTPPVKILISIRADLFFHIVEIQKALQFDLGPHEVLQLTKFTPAEATQVLAVIAQTENLRFEEPFVSELAEQELGDQEDGLISPVDLQIFAWMIERQNASELRAFNRKAFQKFGGVEGLLMRFLDKALMARVSEGQRQAALKVLLALTDLERHVRAGVLTLKDLQQKLTGSLSSQEVRDTVRWLERGDVRLITPISREQEEVGYELAHERLIPSLLMQAGQELKAADQANQLLDRRVNEWLGNNRSSRNLLGTRELWSIKQQKPYLTWGPKRPQKEKLLALSWRRVRGISGVVVATCLGISVFFGWLWYTPEGQIQQVRWALVNPLGGPLDRVSDEDAASVAIAFAKDGSAQKAINIVAKYVDHPRNQSQFFSEFTTVLTRDVDFKSVKENLSLAKTKVEKIDKPFHKSNALRVIAATYGKTNDPKLARQILKNASTIAIKDDDPHTLSKIAATYGEINDPKLAHKILKNALTIAVKNDNPHTLSAIVVAYGEINDPKIVHEGLKNTIKVVEEIADPNDKSHVLQIIAATYGEINDPKIVHEGLKNTLRVAEEIADPVNRSYALQLIAKVYGKIEDPKLAHKVLENALTVAVKIVDLNDRFDALKTIAEVYGEINDPKLAHEVLRDALTMAEKIVDPNNRSFALKAIAEVYGEINDPKLAHEGLEHTLKIANKLDIGPQIAPLMEIAEVYVKIKDPKLANEVLKNVLTITEKIVDPFNILQMIAEVYGKIKDPKLAHEGLKNVLTIAEKFDYNNIRNDKSNALKAIATAYVEINDPKIVHEGLKNTLRVAEEANIGSVMEAISVKYAYLYDWGQSLAALRYCPESWKVKAQAKILTFWAELNNPKIIDGAVILKRPKSYKKNDKYTFTVNLYAPTKGCQQYVDWWEILNEDQKILDRNVFDFSHSDQQPFSDTSNPIKVSKDQTLIIRAHLHFEAKDKMIISRVIPKAPGNQYDARYGWEEDIKDGYDARQAWEGSVKNGFKMVRLPENFATDLSKVDPQPQACQEASKT